MEKKEREKKRERENHTHTHSCKPRLKIPYTTPPHNIKPRVIAECALHKQQYSNFSLREIAALDSIRAAAVPMM